MSDAQAAEIYERLVKGKSKVATAEHVFLRGWNAGIEFAIKQVKLACDEPVEEEDAA